MKMVKWGSQMKRTCFSGEWLVYYLRQRSWVLWIIATLLKQMRKWSYKKCKVSPPSSSNFIAPEWVGKAVFKAKKCCGNSLSFYCCSPIKFLLCIQYICPQSQVIWCLFALKMQFFSEGLCINCLKLWISYLWSSRPYQDCIQFCL